LELLQEQNEVDMKNNIGRPKGEKKYHVMLSMNKKEHDMLVAFAELEKRPKANAAEMLIRDSLQALFSGHNKTTLKNC